MEAITRFIDILSVLMDLFLDGTARLINPFGLADPVVFIFLDLLYEIYDRIRSGPTAPVMSKKRGFNPQI